MVSSPDRERPSLGRTEVGSEGRRRRTMARSIGVRREAEVGQRRVRGGRGELLRDGRVQRVVGQRGVRANLLVLCWRVRGERLAQVAVVEEESCPNLALRR